MFTRQPNRHRQYNNMGFRILIVDDEEDVAGSLRMALSRQGYEVDAFTDPNEALRQFKPDYYDLLLLDIRMNGFGGFELSRELLKQDSKPKVFFMTAFEINLSESTAVFPNLRVDGFIRKPFEIKELVRLITSILKLKE